MKSGDAVFRFNFILCDPKCHLITFKRYEIKEVRVALVLYPGEKLECEHIFLDPEQASTQASQCMESITIFLVDS